MQARKIGNRYRIGGIVGLRNGFEFKNDFQSVLYLLFFGGSVSGNPSLDLERGEFMDEKSFPFQSQENGATRLSDIDSCFLVVEEKKFFDSANGRMVRIDESLEIFSDIQKLLGDSDFRSGSNDTIVQYGYLSPYFFDESKAHGGSPWVDTQNN